MRFFLKVAVTVASLLSFHDVVFAQVGIVKWREVKSPGGVYRLPKVSPKIDIKKFPVNRKNLDSMKAATIEYLNQYVAAYRSAYMEDRKIPAEFSPFEPLLQKRLERIQRKQKNDLNDFSILTDKMFRGESEMPSMTRRLDEVAIFFEESGELNNIRHWLEQEASIKERVNSARKEVDVLDSIGTKKITEASNAISSEVRATVSSVAQLKSRVNLIQFFAWASILVTGLIGAATLVSMARD